MKRDFTDDTKNKIINYLNFIDDFNDTWHNIPKVYVTLIKIKYNILYSIVKAITTLFIKTFEEPSDAMLSLYYSMVLSEKKKAVLLIKTIFDLANEADESFGYQADNILNCGDEILEIINSLSDMANPQTIVNAINYEFPEITFYYNKKDISDEELLNYINKNENNNFIELICDGNAAVSKMGLDVVAAAIAFQFIGVGSEVMSYVDTDSNRAMANKVKEYILNGESGYDSIESIAEKTGYDEKTIRLYLEGKNPYENDELLSGDRSGFKDNKLFDKTALDAIIIANVTKMISDRDLFAKYCKDSGIKDDPDQLRAYINAKNDPDYSEYEKRTYEKSIESAIRKACERDDPAYKEVLDGANDVLSSIKDAYSDFETNTKLGNDLKEKMKNGILSDKEARDFLKNKLGFEKATKSQISALRAIAENFDSLGDAMTILKHGENTIDTISYLFADYSKERETIEYLKKSALVNNPDGSEYYNALVDLEKKYTDNLLGKFNNIAKDAAEYGIETAIKHVPGLNEVETAINVVGEITGANDFTEAALDLMSYPEVCDNVLDSYNYYIGEVQKNNDNAEALIGVRKSYAVMKSTLEDYYKENIIYYEGLKNDSYYDPGKVAYFNYQLDKIKNMRLGDKFEYISYDKFISQYAD